MNKKTFLCTTIASTMILAGITFPMSKAAVEKVVKNSFNVSDAGKAIVIEMSRGAQLQREDIEKIVAERFNKTITKVEGEIGTGAKITLSNNETFTIEIFGDINGDGKVTSSDDEALFNLIGDKKLSSAQQVAGDVSGKKGVQSSDEEALFNRLADKDGKIVDESKWAEYPDNYVAPLDYELKAVKPSNGETEVKAVTADATTNTIIVKEEPKAELKESDTITVELKGIPENSKIESDDGIKFENDTIATDRKIKIPATPDTYSFKLKSGDDSKDITVDVQNCTIATISKIEEIPDEELSKLDKTVAEDMKHGANLWGSTSSTSVQSGKNLELKLNVNKLSESNVKGENDVSLEGNLVAVKVSLDATTPYKFYDNDEELVAYNKTTGEELPTVTGEKGKSYYVYVDSDYVSSDIALINTHTTEDMISTESNKIGKVTITNNGVLGIPKSGVVKMNSILSSEANDDAEANQDQSSNKQVANVVVDNTVRNTINLYAKSELLKEYKIDNNSGKWVGICAQLCGENGDIANIQPYSVSEPNNVLVSTSYKNEIKLESTIKNATKSALIWVKVPDFSSVNDYMKTYTVDFTYTKDGVTETATFTINVYNAGYTYVKSIEAADDYTKNVIPTGYTIPSENVSNIGSNNSSGDGVFNQIITLDAVKSAATYRVVYTESGDKKEGKWIKLKITYNVPVDIIRYSDTGNKANIDATHTVNNDGNNVEGDKYSEYVYFNVGTFTADKLRALYNALGMKENTVTAGDRNVMDNAKNWNASKVTISLNDTSEMKANAKNWAIGGYTVLTNHTLSKNGITNVSAVNSYDLNTQLDNATVGSSTNASIKSKKYGNLVVNGEAGRWVLCYIKVPQSLSNKVTITDTKSAVYVDKENASSLFGITSTTDNGVVYDIVPLWFNLNDMGFDESKEGSSDSAQQTLSTTVKFELKNSSTGATEFAETPVTITYGEE